MTQLAFIMSTLALALYSLSCFLSKKHYLIIQLVVTVVAIVKHEIQIKRQNKSNEIEQN